MEYLGEDKVTSGCLLGEEVSAGNRGGKMYFPFCAFRIVACVLFVFLFRKILGFKL